MNDRPPKDIVSIISSVLLNNPSTTSDDPRGRIADVPVAGHRQPFGHNVTMVKSSCPSMACKCKTSIPFRSDKITNDLRSA